MNFTRKIKKTIKSQNIGRRQEKQLQKLTEEADRSRIAVEHISHVRGEELESKAIGQIKRELQTCIVKINAQQKKQYLLKELNLLLQGQMNKIQSKDKEIKYKEELEIEKKNKELRHDIDKIFEKMNEEIAKIGQLKEKANQSRSQRVVYSKLFKKLEKELKESQDKYKEQILHTEKFRLQFLFSEQNLQKAKIKSLPWSIRYEHKLDNFSSFPSPPSTQRFKKGHQINALLVKNNLRGEEIGFQPEQKGQNLIQKQSCKQQEEQNINPGRSSHRRQQSRNGRMNSTRQNFENYQIVAKELSQFCERIKKEVGCESVEDIENLFETIEEENQRLQKQIEQVNNQMDKIEKQSQKVTSLQYEMEIIENQDQFFRENIDFSVFLHSRGSHEDGSSSEQKQLAQISQQKKEDNTNTYFIDDSQYLCFLEILEVVQLKEEENALHFCPSSIIVEQYSRNIDQIVSFIQQSLKNSHNNFLEGYSNWISLKKSNSASLSGRDQENILKICMQDGIQRVEGNSRVRILSPNKTDLFENENNQYRLRRRESKRDLSSLLTKMHKYSNCQKFFDKQGFELEYRKELEGLEQDQKQNKKMKLRYKKTN